MSYAYKKSDMATTFEYGLYTIGLTKGGLFIVFPATLEDEEYLAEQEETILWSGETLKAAHDYLDRRDKAAEAAARAKLALPVLLDTGDELVEATIKGINRNDRSILFSDYKAKGRRRYNNRPSIFARGETVARLLMEQKMLNQQLSDIRQSLDRLAVKAYLGFGNILGDSEYDKLIETLMESHAAATKVSQQLDATKLAKVPVAIAEGTSTMGSEL